MKEGIDEAVKKARGYYVDGKEVIAPKPTLVPLRWFTAMTGPEQDTIYEILADVGIAAIPANGGKALLLIKAVVINDFKPW